MARCPSCGGENPSHVLFCGKCGQEIPKSVREEAKREEALGISGPGAQATDQLQASAADTRFCTWCGTQLPSGSKFCTSCGRTPWVSAAQPTSQTASYDGVLYPDESLEYHHPSASGTLITGGMLAIIGGILALGQGLLYVIVGSSVTGVAPPSLCLCGGLDIVFGAASIAGGAYAMQAKSFVLALVGAILGMLGLGLLVGFVLGLIATILIAVSRGEFQ